MSFTIQYMLGHKAQITGTDAAGKTGAMVVDTTEWEQVGPLTKQPAADKAFGEVVDEFFGPLLEKVEALKAQFAPAQPDSAEFIVIDEGVEGVVGRPRKLAPLNEHSIILRLIEDDDTDRLFWVDESTLGVHRKA